MTRASVLFQRRKSVIDWMLAHAGEPSLRDIVREAAELFRITPSKATVIARMCGRRWRDGRSIAGLTIDEGENETPGQRRARIAGDIAAGRRCEKCFLLTPCGGHDWSLVQSRRNSWMG